MSTEFIMNKTNNESTLLSDTLLNQVNFRVSTRIAGKVFSLVCIYYISGRKK